jgi:DNA primase
VRRLPRRTYLNGLPEGLGELGSGWAAVCEWYMDGTMRNSDLRSRVLEATNIVDLVGRTVTLKRAGKDFIGLCPFHQEKTPSFHVSPAKQFFYCFGCKKNGNVIDFLIERDRLEFKDALRQLAQAAGIPVTELSGSGQKPGEMQVLRDANSAACMFFEKQLASPAGAAAREYLKSRGFTDESIKRFRVGFALDAWDGLFTSAAKKFAPGQLALAGLIKPREGGAGYYDTFRNRVMFPIRDAEGRIIAFGGRVMPGSDDKAKYLNSPETPLFDKGRCAFGIDLAKDKLVQSRVAAIVEGYTDVMMAHQYGCSNVVSTLGTALTARHLMLLGRFVDRVVLLFDPDAAGDLAVDRAVELFLTQEKVEIQVASLPDGLDPDEFLLKNGAAAFDAVLANATDALTYKWRQLVKRFNGSGGEVNGQQKAVGEYLGLLSSAKQSGSVDSLRWGAVLTRVNRLTGIPTADLHRRFKAKPAQRTRLAPKVIGRDQPNAVVPAAASMSTARDKVEARLLGFLLCEPGNWVEAQKHIQPEDFLPGPRRELAEIYWRHQRDEGEPVLSHFLSLLEDPAVRAIAAQLAQEATMEADTAEATENPLQSGLEYLLRERQRQRSEQLEAQTRAGGENEEVAFEELVRSHVADLRRLPERSGI